MNLAKKLGAAIVAMLAVTGALAAKGAPRAPADGASACPPGRPGFFKSSEKYSEGSVVVAGRAIPYRAVAGAIPVRPRGFDDVLPRPCSEALNKEDKNPSAQASIFYVAYFKKGAKPEGRPLTFLYNGGPGSSTVWLHMGAFGPRRVVTADDSHTPAAPYRVVSNDWSLLDASDLVFIDAPGTGFSRIAGKDKKKAFWGVDQDAHAFAEFIMKFLSKYGRWNSPKYLFGESYGTTRSAVLIDQLETVYNVDFNGVIFLSQVLNYDLGPDGPENNPSVDLPYVLALPTYAATAWYHHKLPGPPRRLEELLGEVEKFATGDYAQALSEGLGLAPKRAEELARKLSAYTGLSVDYIQKARLRIDGGEFEKNLRGRSDFTIGRLDTRFSGPTLDPLSKESGYDPQSAAIGSAYVSAFNDYVRKSLGYAPDEMYKSEIELWKTWDYRHKPPHAEEVLPQATNVMPDLADAMKQNPNLKVLLHAGYFDLATPFYEGIYEMRHLQIPEKLFPNIAFRFYRSGHMVYAHSPSLKRLHDSTAAFIRSTANLKAP